MQPLFVVIATHGRSDLLERTLASLGHCTIPDAYAETIVVENGSRGGAEGVVAASQSTYPALRLRYLHVERANKSLALNRALEGIEHGLILFLDDDVRVHERLLCRYAEAAEGLEGGTVFGSSIGVDYEERPPEWLIPLLPHSARGMGLQSPDRLWHYLGCSWAAFASDLRAAGLFDPDVGPGAAGGATGQETDMQRRLARRGVARVDLPDVLVWHYVPKERCSLDWYLHRRIRNGLTASSGSRGRGRSSAWLALETLGWVAWGLGMAGWGALRLNRTGFWRGIGALFKAAGRAKGLGARVTRAGGARFTRGG